MKVRTEDRDSWSYLTEEEHPLKSPFRNILRTEYRRDWRHESDEARASLESLLEQRSSTTTLDDCRVDAFLARHSREVAAIAGLPRSAKHERARRWDALLALAVQEGIVDRIELHRLRSRTQAEVASRVA